MTKYGQFTIGIGSLTLNSNVRQGQNFYMLTNVPAILGELSVRNDDTEKQGDHGTEDGPSYYGARTIPVSGEIHAITAANRFTMEQDLRAELALPIDQDIAGDDGYKLILITDQDGVEKQLYAKVITPPSFEQLPDIRERRSRFSFVLYAKDPKIYSQSLTTSSGVEGYTLTTFTMQDSALPTFQDGDLPTFQDALGGVLVVTNSIGTYGTPPLIIIYGPTTSPTVTNETTRKSMKLDGLTLLTGERVEIDVSGTPVTITKIDGAGVETDASGYLTDESRWIFLNPGANSMSLFDETEAELTASLEVRWRDCWQ